MNSAIARRRTEVADPLFITKDGTLERRENTIYFENQFQKVPLPVEQVSEIYCFSHVSMSSGVIHFLSSNEIPVHFFNHYGFYDSTLWPRKRTVSGNIAISQARAYLSPENRFRLASSFVVGAGLNMVTLLKTQNRKDIGLTDLIEGIRGFLDGIPDSEPSVNRLMGIEGNIRKLYYEGLDRILPDWLQIRTREFRPPSNPGNAVMSFLNSLSYSACLSEIYRTQLDPTISFLHEPGERRFSLSLDIAEIFKPAITDRIFLRLANLHMLKEEHFDADLKSTMLSETGRKLVLKTAQDKLNDTITHKGLKRKISYRGVIRQECYKILNDVVLGKNYKPTVAWW